MSYAGTQAWFPKGTQLEFSTTSGGTYTAVAEIDEVSRSGAKRDTSDASNMESGDTKEFIGLMRDEGDADFGGNWLPQDATQQALQAQYTAGALTYFKIVLPSPQGSLSFAGIVVQPCFMPKLDLKSQAKFTCKIKISGDVTQGS
jgi:predicted secreted protein